MRYVLVMFLVLLVILPAIGQDTEGQQIEGLQLLEGYPAVEFWFKAFAGQYPQMATRRVACSDFLATDAEMHITGDEDMSFLNFVRGQSNICSEISISVQNIFPDQTFIIEVVVVEDDFVVVRYTGQYTYSWGSKAEKISYPGMAMFELENDQLKTIWDYFDHCDRTPMKSCP